MKLDDGLGSGRQAAITKRHQLRTRSEAFGAAAVASESGDCFSIPTKNISITTLGTQHGVLYVLNNSERDLRLSSLRLSSGNTEVHWRLIKNPKTGTLISAGVAVVPQNSRFNSGGTFSGDVKEGVDGSTVTDGEVIDHLITLGGSHALASLDGVILGKGDSFAVTVALPDLAKKIAVSSVWYYSGA